MAAFPRNSIRSFLVHAKGALHTAITNHERVTLVIGNESADLDSLTCSLLYAYIRSQCPPQSAFTPLYIPVTNLPAADLQLRPEFLALLPHANLQPQHLITLDDLPPLDSIGQILSAENTKWILVDHNALQGILGKVYGGRVGGTIDHHEDEHKVPDDTGDEPRVITKSGSCSSLVTEYLRPTWDALSSAGLSSGAAHGQADGAANDAAQVKLWDAQAAQLVLASVLIDTSNLMSKEKTTEHDVAASGYLEAKVMLCDRTDPGFSKDKFYGEINRAKQDIGRLALNDILRKDYKQWNEGGVKLGISSVVKPLDFLQEKAKEGKHGNLSFCDALGEFAKQRGLEMYAIMTAFTTEAGEFRRQLLLWALSERAEAQARAFAESATTELELQELEGAYHVAGRDPGWKKPQAGRADVEGEDEVTSPPPRQWRGAEKKEAKRQQPTSDEALRHVYPLTTSNPHLALTFTDIHAERELLSQEMAPFMCRELHDSNADIHKLLRRPRMPSLGAILVGFK